MSTKVQFVGGRQDGNEVRVDAPLTVGMKYEMPTRNYPPDFIGQVPTEVYVLEDDGKFHFKSLGVLMYMTASNKDPSIPLEQFAIGGVTPAMQASADAVGGALMPAIKMATNLAASVKGRKGTNLKPLVDVCHALMLCEVLSRPEQYPVVDIGGVPTVTMPPQVIRAFHEILATALKKI